MRNTKSSSSKVTQIIISSAIQISRLKKMEQKPKEFLSITTGGQNQMCDFRATMLHKTKSKWNKQASLQKPRRDKEPWALPPWNRTSRFWSTVEQGMWPTTGVIKITQQSAWTKRETLPSLRVTQGIRTLRRANDLRAKLTHVKVVGSRKEKRSSSMSLFNRGLSYKAAKHTP